MPQETNTLKNMQKAEQRLTLDNRKQLCLSGVEKVLSFCDKEISLLTILGQLLIKGENLHISKLNVDTGDFSAEGYISSLTYQKSSKKSDESFFVRLFK